MELAALASVGLSLLSPNDAPERARLGDECLKGLAPALKTGSFSGSTNCKHDSLAITKVGVIKSRPHRFTVYDYHYRLKPACAKCAVHGGQRIIVMRDGHYLGQFKPDQASRAIRGRNLILFHAQGATGQKSSAIVRFSSGGPPKYIFFEGLRMRFFR
jgi:hypothetical protein